MELLDIAEMEEIKPIRDEHTEIMVSVWCTTYNHEPYIRDALEGFVMQKTDFDYEVVVYDDASTDGTSDILREYAEKYPEIFHLFLAKKNIYRHSRRKNFLMAFRHKFLIGKYVAYCEGDDYWIDENKLQMQVDYMEEHPECSMYTHNCQRLNCDTGQTENRKIISIEGEGDVCIEELIAPKIAHPSTASFLFRRELFEAPFFFYNTSVGDYPLVLCAAAHGKVHYNSKIMSVYRWKSKESHSDRFFKDTSLQAYHFLGLIQFLRDYNQYTDKKYKKVIWLQAYGWIKALFDVCEQEGISVEESYQRCKENGYYLDLDDDTLKQLDELMMWNKEEYLDDRIKTFISKYSNIVIMGAGQYAQILTKQLEYYKISFEGYVVSDPENNRTEFNGRKVWSLYEIPFEKNKLGVVVGIFIAEKSDVLEFLMKAGISNYCMPFAVHLFE